MAAAISSEKIDLLVYGPHKPIVDSGFSDQFVLHKFETRGDLDRLTPAVAELPGLVNASKPWLAQVRPLLSGKEGGGAAKLLAEVAKAAK